MAMMVTPAVPALCKSGLWPETLGNGSLGPSVVRNSTLQSTLWQPFRSMALREVNSHRLKTNARFRSLAPSGGQADQSACLHKRPAALKSTYREQVVFIFCAIRKSGMGILRTSRSLF